MKRRWRMTNEQIEGMSDEELETLIHTLPSDWVYNKIGANRQMLCIARPWPLSKSLSRGRRKTPSPFGSACRSALKSHIWLMCGFSFYYRANSTTLFSLIIFTLISPGLVDTPQEEHILTGTFGIRRDRRPQGRRNIFSSKVF